MRYKALVFDMDGTLLNTLEDLADSTNFALVKHGFPEQPTEAYRYFVGSGARKLVERALPEEARNPETIDVCLAAYKEHYNENWANKTRLYDGLAEVLNQLSTSTLKFGILTNKPKDFADECVKHFLSSWTWQIVQGQEEGIALKPSADISRLVTEALAVEPSEVLYLGDSDVDMLTAKNAGYTSVGVTWGFRTEQELVGAGAEHIVHAPSEIIELLS